MEYRILGPIEVRVGDVLLYIGGPRERRSLAALLLHANRAVNTERLVEVLWGEQAPATAATQIRNTIATLRRHLAAAASDGRAPIIRAGAGFVVQVNDAELDAVVFDRHVTQARSLAQQGQLGAAAAALRTALSLWHGSALGGLGGPVLDAEARGLEERRLTCLERRIELDLALGRHQDLIGELAVLVGEHPLRERLIELQMFCLYRAGRRQDALAAFTAARNRFSDHMGLDPLPELARLQQAILRGDSILDLARSGDREAAASYPPERPRPAQLPADVPAFTGRTAYLERLDTMLPSDDGDEPATVVISAIAGTAGVGKTALAMHWAHRVRRRFGDGQLYVNLRGFDQGGSSVDAAEALRGFLDALGVPPSRVPAEIDARAGLYRSLLADRQMLVVLDNARDAEQVRPLLPGASGCLVVVTSRNQLSGLVASQGARMLMLDLLSAAEARELLARRLGLARLAADPHAVDEIVTCCAGLPLALVIVAARAVIHPEFSVTALADELRDAHGRLNALAGQDAFTDVRAVFSWSYHALSAEAAHLFRLLGLLTGPDVALSAAASLAGMARDEARWLLAELVGAHLVVEHKPGRYALHDLLRTYAAELVRTVDAEHDRQEAVRRLLDHYLHTAHTGALLLQPHRDPIDLAPAHLAVTTESLGDGRRALDWFVAEHPALLAAVGQAAEVGLDIHVWQLAWTLEIFYNRQGHWYDRLTTQTNALGAAQRLHDRPVQALAHRGIGDASVQLGRDDEANTHLGYALELYGQLGDDAGQAHTHQSLARVCERQGRHRDVLSHSQRALDLYRSAGHILGQARALNGIGWSHTLLGEHQEALAYCQQALTLHREIGDRHGEADTWDSLGYIHHQLGQHIEAATYYQHAVNLFRELGNRYDQAVTLIRLGDAHHAADSDGAAHAWRLALDILDEMGHADAEQVRARLQTPAVVR